VEILKRRAKKLISSIENNSVFYGIYSIEVILIAWLNAKNETMSGILAYYQDFANLFASGFDYTTPFKMSNPTFPMWGYGLIMLIFKSKFIIVVLQLLTMMFVTWKWDNHLATGGKKTLVFRGLVLLGISYIIFHTPLWPYSFSASFIALSLLYLLKSNLVCTWKNILMSSALMGLALNFRSDYLYFAFLLIVVLIILRIFKKSELSYNAITIYGCTIILFLLPWMLHTNQINGHYSMSSTNSGHVLYLGLGQQPGNPWGITVDDADPKMRKILKEQLGYENSLSYQADVLLKKEWLNSIKSNPVAFVKKCGFSFYYMMIRPFSNGEFERRFTQDSKEIELLKTSIKTDVLTFNISSLAANTINGKYMAFLLSMFLNLINIIIFICIILFMMYGISKLKYQFLNDVNRTVIFSIIGYQLLIQTIALYNPNYHTNIYIYYAIICQMIYSALKTKSIP
jgi:hypothetical protein